jgi:hypothetical protein
VTRQTRLLLGVVAALAALAAYWFLLLAPKREEAAALATQVEQKEAAVAQAESTLASYRDAESAFKGLYTTVARLGKAVPADDDVRSLVVQLESAASASKVDFRSIEVGTGSAAPTDATATPAAPTDKPLPPGAVPVGSAGFSTMAFNLEFNGDFLRLSDLFSRLERFVRVNDDRIDVTGRLLRVESVTLTPNGEDYRDLTATVNASTYLVPATEGLTGGATAQAPAAPTTPTEPSTAGTTPPVTTATSTGALR